MNKLNPIKYIENMLSHHPKSFYLWITDGIVIDDKRYIIKEFRLRDGKLYAVIAENKYNPKYFEVQLCPDEETLKAIYKAIEDNKVAIKKEITDRKNEIARVDAAIKANTTKINQEITDRTNEITRVDNAIKANTAKINKEITDRTNEVTRLDKAINANTAKINQEITDRENEINRVDAAIKANTAKINQEITDRTDEITRVDAEINKEIADRTREITRVDNVVKSNTAKIDKEIVDRKSEIARVDKAIEDNKGSIDQEVTNINNAINANTTKINQEITNRQNEINRVDGVINSNTTKINKEIADRKSEINRVNTAIDSNTTKINKEITDRTSEVARLDKTIKDNKAAADQTAAGFNTRIESLETYKDGEQTRANQYFESAKAETTRQLTAERAANADKYVTKSAHTSDVTGIRNDLAATTSTANTAVSKANEAQATADSAVTKANAVQTTANNNAKTIGTHTTQINTLNSSLAQKQDKLTAGNGITIQGNVISSTGDAASQDAAIKANTAKINQEITDRKNEITRVESKIPTSIGAVNLFKGSRDFSGTGWVNNSNGVYAEDYKDIKIYKTQAIWIGRSQYFEAKTGEEYVFSAYVKSSIKADRVTFFLSHESKQPMATGLVGFDSANSQDAVTFDLTDEYQRIAIKIKIIKDGWIMPRLERFNSDAYLFFGGYKLERGTVATDWSPAPEDYDAKLDSVKSEIKQTTDDITASVSSAQTAASNAQSTANTAVTKADTAQSTADSAVTKATTAQSTADSATTKANAAQSTANSNASKITELQGKVCKVVNIDTANYSGHYSISNGVVTQYKVVAKDGKYIDLDNFTFSSGTDPLASARLDSRLLKVLFEYVDTRGKTLLTTSNVLFTIDTQRKIVVDKNQVTSGLCAQNLSKVKSISLL